MLYLFNVSCRKPMYKGGMFILNKMIILGLQNTIGNKTWINYDLF